MQKRILIILTIVFFFSLTLSCDPSPPYESNNSNYNSPSPDGSPVSNKLSSPTETLSTAPKPARLIEIIKELQKEFVRESYGEPAHQCFTDNDLNNFINRKKTVAIEERLTKSKDFAATLAAINDMPPDEREKLMGLARQTYKETWAEKGMNPATTPPDSLRKYQTDAGKEAEKMIAETVVNLAVKMNGDE